MNDDLARAIATQCGVALRPASDDGIRQLQALGIPDDAITFYRQAEPAECAEIEKIRLWPIKRVAEENTDYVPGCYTQPYGYVVFATTFFGDTYCFDLNSGTSSATAPIVLLSHEMIGDETTKEEVGRLAKKMAPDFPSFLEAFVAGKLDMTPNYE